VINSPCAVFAESEIISQVNAGKKSEDILSGVLRSIAARAATLVERSDASGRVALCGGVAKLPAFRVMFERMIKGEALLPDLDSQIIVSYGAALLGQARGALRAGGGHGPAAVRAEAS
jgi:activator of 2-hydroxyglutaryl-CoA dehydratase